MPVSNVSVLFEEDVQIASCSEYSNDYKNNIIILTLLDMLVITKGLLGRNMVSQHTMNKIMLIRSIDLIRLQWIEFDVFSHKHM